MATQKPNEGKYGPCPICGRPNSRSRRSGCSSCYQTAYRADPERKRAHQERVADYQSRNPAKRHRWVTNYRIRIGQHVPALQALRRAIKRLDATVAYAEGRDGVRQSDEPGSDDAAEW